jgi:hypothetical protein
MPKFIKGSAAAKAFMAKLRASRGKTKVGKAKAKPKRKGLFVKKLAVYARPTKSGKVKPYVRKVGSLSTYNKAPLAVRKLIDSLDNISNYSDKKKIVKSIEAKGYMIEFAMDGSIERLKKITHKKVGAVKAPVYKYAAVKKRVDDLYKKSGMINTNEKWENKIIEMLQDNSIEAYTIYQKLNPNQKKDVLNELFIIDNDMGSYGDGKLQTSKQNLAILLQDAKNGIKYKDTIMGMGAVKKTPMSKHKDMFSHNVNIKVVSGMPGMNKNILNKLHDLTSEIANIEQVKNNFKNNIVNLEKEDRPKARGIYKYYVQYLKELKTHMRELKKQIK